MDSLAARAGRTKKNRLKKAMDTARIPPIPQRTRNEWGTRILEWMDRFKRYSAAMDRMVRLMGHLANRAITFWARVCQPLARLRCLIGIVRAGRREELFVEFDGF